MKKKFLSFTLAFVCVIGCLFCLTACGGDGDTKKIHWLCAVKADETPTQSSSHLIYNLTYGETPDLTYKLYGYYGDDDVFREISLTDPKLTVKYYAYYAAEEYKEKELTALPSNWVSGGYAIKYVYDGDSKIYARISIDVVQAEGAAFTVASVDGTTTWGTNDQPHKIRVMNPQNRPVQMTWLSSDNGISHAPIEKKDDTDGHYDLYFFKKNVYENFSATKRADYEFLKNYFYKDNRDHDVYYYAPDSPYSVCVGVPAGDYVLVALVHETWNYLSSVSQGLAITITD